MSKEPSKEQKITAARIRIESVNTVRAHSPTKEGLKILLNYESLHHDESFVLRTGDTRVESYINFPTVAAEYYDNDDDDTSLRLSCANVSDSRSGRCHPPRERFTFLRGSGGRFTRRAVEGGDRSVAFIQNLHDKNTTQIVLPSRGLRLTVKF